MKGRLSGWEAVRTLRFLLVCSIVVPPLAFALGGYYVYETIHGHAKADLVRTAAVAEEHAAKVIELNQLVIERINDLLAPYDDDAIRSASRRSIRSSRKRSRACRRSNPPGSWEVRESCS